MPLLKSHSQAVVENLELLTQVRTGLVEPATAPSFITIRLSYRLTKICVWCSHLLTSLHDISAV